MKELIHHTVLDTIKLVPFLFLAFLIIELIEHKFSKKTKKIITKSGRFGPLLGSVLGLFPQCGFSVMATNLYVTRIISIGTLVSIYLTTSDEMLPILLANGSSISLILKLLGIKFIIGIMSGFLIDFILRRRKKEKIDYHICDEEECHCEDGIFLSVLKHTFNTFLFIFAANFLINLVIHYFGEESFSSLFLKDNILSPFISSLVGLIPNCASSVVITELYLENAISLGSCMAGLLTGSGVAILFLFKSNKNVKESFMILGLIYGIGVISGLIIDVFSMLI